MKLTFIGDIMCEPAILNAAKQPDGSYCFDALFSKVGSLFREADFVTANLETPLAGEEVGYTDSFYRFNAPDSIADAIKKAGIGLISTANNHTFDRGMAGAVRTLQILDEKGIPHTGSYAPGTPREGAAYFEVSGTKFAVLASTYSTNYNAGENDWRNVLAEGEYAGTLNLLRSQKETVYLPGVFKGDDWVDKTFKDRIPDEELRGRLKILLGIPGNYGRSDDNLHPETMAPYMDQLQADIREARTKADVVIVYPHVGGQFNATPGAITRHVVEKCLEAGADAVLAGHSHCVHKVELRDGAPIAYSLGNFSMCPYSSLMVQERLPAYGLAVHLYVEDKKIRKTTFSILKGVQKKGTPLVSWPVDELYETLSSDKERAALEADVAAVYRTVTEKEIEGDIIRREYSL